MPLYLFSIVKRVWETLKQHKKIVAGVLVCATFLYLVKSRDDDWASRYRDLTEQHVNELNQLKEIHSKERDALQKNIEEMQKQLSESQVRYERDVARLNAKASARVREIMAQHGSDPSALAAELGRVTGFRVGSK
jgi:DNA anti-recombination protein RmuC